MISVSDMIYVNSVYLENNEASIHSLNRKSSNTTTIQRQIENSSFSADQGMTDCNMVYYFNQHSLASILTLFEVVHFLYDNFNCLKDIQTISAENQDATKRDVSDMHFNTPSTHLHYPLLCLKLHLLIKEETQSKQIFYFMLIRY